MLESEQRTGELSPTERDAADKQLNEFLVLRDSLQDFWSNVIIWVALAEGLLPLCSDIVGSIFDLIGIGASGIASRAVFIFLGMIAFGYTILFAVTLVVAGVTSALVSLICGSMNLKPTNALGGACVGGLVGLVYSLPLVSLQSQGLLVMFLGTTLGQIGGAYGSHMTFYRNRFADQKPPPFALASSRFSSSRPGCRLPWQSSRRRT